MRILVVDDSTAVRSRIATLLRDIEGVELVAEAENAARAVDLWRSISPHFVILDLDLAGRSGLEILPILKERKAADPTVLVLTNHAEDAYARRCRALGADYFFDKSNQFETAIDIVRSNIATRLPRD
jgi:DNA-binding NarL/FixJ family response regulator